MSIRLPLDENRIILSTTSRSYDALGQIKKVPDMERIVMQLEQSLYAKSHNMVSMITWEAHEFKGFLRDGSQLATVRRARTICRDPHTRIHTARRLSTTTGYGKSYARWMK